MTQNKKNSKALLAWALYDWASSPFAVIIQTFVFAAYFVKNIAPDEITGSAQWGLVNGISALIVALCSPIFGAAADLGGRRKTWIALFTLLCIIPTALLWYITPNHKNDYSALLLVGIGTVGMEGAYIFYNAMLPDLSPPTTVGRWSGWGWGMGYIGGVVALFIALEAFISQTAWFPLDHAQQEPIRATFLMTAVWYTLFATPLFLFTPKTPSKGIPFYQAAIEGVKQVVHTLKEIHHYRYLARFYLAKLIYVDGLATLFAFGGIYAASTFNMDEKEIMQFGIGMNVTAGLGAVLFAFVDDRLGGKKMILLSLIGLLIPGTICLLVTTKMQFWIFGLSLCIFVGPLQASSRSYLARIAPPELRNEMFGFYMLSGKATAFAGPLILGWITYLTDSQRLGMSTVMVFFVIGGLIMMTIPNDFETKAKRLGVTE